MTADLKIVPLQRTHDRKRFTCGVDSLDAYLKTQAGQDVRRKANAVYVMVRADEPKQVMGYYTLCGMGLAYVDLPDEVRKPLPRYSMISAILIGRLAVDRGLQGQGLGFSLLIDALQRAYDSTQTVGASLVVVDAIDEQAESFYVAHGFIRLMDTRRLIMPMQSIGMLRS